MKSTFTFLFLVFAGAYALKAQAPTNGLIASYSFNAGTAVDETGDNNGAVYGATITTDRFGNANHAYSFDGIDDYIDFGDSSEFRMDSSNFAISFWLYYVTPQLSQVIGKRSTSTYDQYNFLVGGNLLGVPTVDTVTGILFGSNFSWRTVQPISLIGAWHHVVLNHNRDSVTEMYVDGVLHSSASGGPASMNLDVAGAPLLAGKLEYGQGQYYQGKLDDIKFYNRFLSAAGVDSLYNDLNPTTIGMSEFGASNFIVFPNPSNEVFSWNINSNVAVLDINGRVVLTASNTKSINLSGFATGVYFMNVLDDNGAIIARKKLIKQ